MYLKKNKKWNNFPIVNIDPLRKGLSYVWKASTTMHGSNRGSYFPKRERKVKKKGGSWWEKRCRKREWKQISGLHVLFCSFPAYVGVAIRSPPLFPILLASAGRPEELLLSLHACCSECLLSPPCTPTYHPPHTRAPKAQRPAGHREGGRCEGVCVSVCVCVDSGVERVRKKEGGGEFGNAA